MGIFAFICEKKLFKKRILMIISLNCGKQKNEAIISHIINRAKLFVLRRRDQRTEELFIRGSHPGRITPCQARRKAPRRHQCEAQRLVESLRVHHLLLTRPAPPFSDPAGLKTGKRGSRASYQADNSPEPACLRRSQTMNGPRAINHLDSATLNGNAGIDGYSVYSAGRD